MATIAQKFVSELERARTDVFGGASAAVEEDVSRPRRERIPKSVRHAVWRRDGGACADCGSRERLEFDHIIPVSKGGSNTARNLELRCETSEALAALDSVPPRIDSRYVFTTSRKCPGTSEPRPFDVANFRRRVWAPAIDSAGIAKPARIYDLRSTFISNALANGLTVFETARVAGTSVKMIEAHYGALLDTAHGSLLERLEATGS